MIGSISVWAGAFIGRFLSDAMSNIIGAVFLIGIGVWVMIPKKHKSVQQENCEGGNSPTITNVLQEPELADTDHSASISWNETGILGVALSINVMTNVISAGLWRLGVIPTSLLMAVFSYLTIWAGTWIGSRYGANWLGNKASTAAGILLILIGLHQLL